MSKEQIVLHVSSRLRDLLPKLTAQELTQLEKNLLSDGKVLDPILYWHDGKQNVIVDGMHRYPLAQKHKLPFNVRAVEIGETYEQAEEWVWDHQAGRRNMTRESIGEWYNRLKGRQGGDHTSQKSKVSNDTLLGDAAVKVAEKAGVSAVTVKRDGARVDALKQCAPPIQKGIEAGAFTATDAEIKTLAKLPEQAQTTVATSLRKGQAKNMKAALAGVKGQAVDYGKCPACAGTKWRKVDGKILCAKCQHPHGEPAGDPSEELLKTQRQKTVKTAEALMRAFDDLHMMKARKEHKEAIDSCKRLLGIAKGWT